MKILKGYTSLFLVAASACFFLFNLVQPLFTPKKNLPMLVEEERIVTKQRPFVIVIMGEQSGKCSSSIAEQDYAAYRTVRGVNLDEVVKSCSDEEILLFVRGQDWLAHHKVLSVLNQCYEDPKVWMTYGNHLVYPSYKTNRNKEIAPQLIKSGRLDLIVPPVQSGYAALFKKVDLAREEQLFVLALKKAEEHSLYVRDILYIVNGEDR